MTAQQTSKLKNRSGWIMLIITLILYVFTSISDPSIALAALNKSMDALKMIAPILLIVFFFDGFVKQLD